jgi:cell division protein FtsB
METNEKQEKQETSLFGPRTTLGTLLRIGVIAVVVYYGAKWIRGPRNVQVQQYQQAQPQPFQGFESYEPPGSGITEGCELEGTNVALVQEHERLKQEIRKMQEQLAAYKRWCEQQIQQVERLPQPEF